MEFRQGNVEADGFIVRYWEAGQGRPVIMLDQAGWRDTPLHEALAEKYRIFALELPGTGDYAANMVSKSIKDLASVAAGAAASLASDRYTLIGTSYGAHIALWQTLTFPEQVEALILISPTAIKPLGSSETTTQKFHDSMFAHIETSKRFVPMPADVFVKESRLMGRLKIGIHDFEVESQLADIHCPTLAIFGKDDRLVSSEAARIYREKIPNCNIAIAYDAGHCIVGDRPEALINSVIDYAEHWETFIVGHKSGIINP